MRPAYNNRHSLLLLVIAVLCYSCQRQPAAIYPQQRALVEAVYASGKVIAEDEYNLFALNTGRVEKKLVKEGDTVEQGQLLYIISNEAAKARLAAAQESYNISVANKAASSPLLSDLQLSLESTNIKLYNDSINYFRWKRLWEQQIGSKSNLDNNYSNYQLAVKQQKIAAQKYLAALNDIRLSFSNASSALAAAREELSHCFITSPEKGIVFQTFKEPGEAVRSNEMIALMGRQGSNRLRLAVDQQDISRIQPGQQVLVQADITGSAIFQAMVTRIYPVMNEADQTFRVDAEFVAPTGNSFIHGSVEANIIVQRKNNALVLPRDALVAKDSVYIRSGGKKRKTWIKTGIQTMDDVEILQGIDKNTPVLPAGKN